MIKNFHTITSSNIEAIRTSLKEVSLEDVHFDELLVSLRSKLLRLEEQEGISEIHYKITETLLEKEFTLKHFYGVSNDSYDVTVSPNGKYIAVGSGSHYELGGSYILIEADTEKCVHKLENIRGGVGYFGEPNRIQFSPDSRYIAFVFDTNIIALMPIHADTIEHIFDVTNGYSSPPTFKWIPDSKGVYINLVDKIIPCYIHEEYNIYSAREGDDFPAIYKYDEISDDEEIDDEEEIDDFGRPNENFHFMETISFTPQGSLSKKIKIHSGLPENQQFPNTDKITLESIVLKRNETKLFDFFPIFEDGQWSWMMAQHNGLIYCPESYLNTLDKYLHFTLKNKYAWFFRWLAPQNPILEIHSEFQEVLKSNKCTLSEEQLVIFQKR